MLRPTVSHAIQSIERHGALLLFPVNNKPEPLSLWRCFFDDREMDWDWSEDGEDAVPKLWHMRTELSESREVIYAKWYQGRATFLSLELFGALVSEYSRLADPTIGLLEEARTLHSVLLEDSPLPTKELKARSELDGKLNEGAFNRAMKQLWSRLLIVGAGEVEEGGFPSLATGATRLLFEELWDSSRSLTPKDAQKTIRKYLEPSKLLLKHYLRVRAQLDACVECAN